MGRGEIRAHLLTVRPKWEAAKPELALLGYSGWEDPSQAGTTRAPAGLVNPMRGHSRAMAVQRLLGAEPAACGPGPGSRHHQHGLFALCCAVV